jgi:hypothetical protein
LCAGIIGTNDYITAASKEIDHVGREDALTPQASSTKNKEKKGSSSSYRNCRAVASVCGTYSIDKVAQPLGGHPSA